MLVGHWLVKYVLHMLALVSDSVISSLLTSREGILSNFSRGGSRTAQTSKMENIVIIVNSFQLSTFTTNCSILHVAAVLYPPLKTSIDFTETIASNL